MGCPIFTRTCQKHIESYKERIEAKRHGTIETLVEASMVPNWAKIIKWLQHQVEQLLRQVKNSRNEANKYQENISGSVESINSAVGDLLSTNRAIEKAIEYIKQIV